MCGLTIFGNGLSAPGESEVPSHSVSEIEEVFVFFVAFEGGDDFFGVFEQQSYSELLNNSVKKSLSLAPSREEFA